MHFPSQWKTYSCQRCKWDFLPLITNRKSAPIASRSQSKQQQRVATDQIPSSSKSPAELQTDPPLRLREGLHKQRSTDSREVSPYCCEEQLRLSHRASGARHSLHAGDNLELGPTQISAADQVFQIPQYQTHPNNCPAVLDVCGVHAAVFSSHSAVWERKKNPKIPNPHKLAKGTKFNPVS